MRIVKNKKELKQALEDGEKEVYVDNERLFIASRLVEKFQRKGGGSSSKFRKDYQYGMNIAIEASTIITITISVLIMALIVLAIYKKYEVSIETEVDPTTGKIKGKVKFSPGSAS